MAGTPSRGASPVEQSAPAHSVSAAGVPNVAPPADADVRPVPPARETIRHPPANALDLSQVLRTLGDPLRLRMVRMLADGNEMCCGPLGDALGLPKSTASYHLRLLREAGVTRTRQEGTLRYVSLRREDLDACFPGLVAVLMVAE